MAQVGPVSSVQVRSGSRGAHFPPCPPSSPSSSPLPQYRGAVGCYHCAKNNPQQGESGEGPSQVCGWRGWVGKAGAVRCELRRGLWAEQMWQGDGRIESVGQQEPGEGRRSRGSRSRGPGCSWPWTCSHFQEENVLLGKEQSRGAGQCCRRDPGLTWRHSRQPA